MRERVYVCVRASEPLCCETDSVWPAHQQQRARAQPRRNASTMDTGSRFGECRRYLDGYWNAWSKGAKRER